MKKLGAYRNGNYIVTMFDDGTKVRETINPNDTEFIPSISENTDVNLTLKCSQNCNFCLTENSIIKTIEGDKFIRNIHDGDMVYSYNVKTGDIEIKPVIETYVREYEGDLIEIETEYGILRCTPNHKLYTENRGYIEAKNIQITDTLLFFK